MAFQSKVVGHAMIHTPAPKSVFSLIILCLLAILILPGFGRSDPVRRGLDTFAPPFRESVLRGWRYFNTSYADDGVSCVHCHSDHSDIISWPGSYPKVQIFDQSPYQVKTLRAVILEAMVRHTDLEPVESMEMAQDIEAYIAWWGDGQRLIPGSSREGMTPEEDLGELAQAVSRGRLFFNRERPTSCTHCHTAEETQDHFRRHLNDVYLQFPRSIGAGDRTVSLDTYLLDHYKKHGVVMNTRNITEIAAYLADLSRGKHLRPGGLEAKAAGSKEHSP